MCVCVFPVNRCGLDIELRSLPHIFSDLTQILQGEYEKIQESEFFTDTMMHYYKMPVVEHCLYQDYSQIVHATM